MEGKTGTASIHELLCILCDIGRLRRLNGVLILRGMHNTVLWSRNPTKMCNETLAFAFGLAGESFHQWDDVHKGGYQERPNPHERRLTLTGVLLRIRIDSA